MIMINEFHKKTLREEFSDFELPEGSSGGCQKSIIANGLCVRFRRDEKAQTQIAGFYDNRECYYNCVGYSFSYPESNREEK